MKIGRYQITLSRPKGLKTDAEEQGTSGNLASGYLSIDDYLGRTRTPSIKRIMDMIDNDGTAQALYSFIKFPVLATNWHIEPHPDDIVKDANGGESHPQAEFVENALRRPLHEGGMSTPFSLVLEDILLGVAQGYRFFEIVYKLDDEGRVVFQKVAARDHWEYDIQTDDTGGFAGVKQRVTKNGKTQTILLEIPYCFLYTYDKARNKLKGRSAFRAGWYHFDKKHRLYYLQNQQGQQMAVPYKVLEEPDDQVTKEQRTTNLKVADALGTRSTVALPFGWKLTFAQQTKGVDMQPWIDGHDVQMARAVLAQGLMQGNSTASSGGSYSLGEQHFDAFMLGEQALMNGIEEHVTSYLVSKLYDYNFAKPLFGRFKFEDMSDPVRDLAREAFKSLVAKGTIPKWVSDGIAENIAQQMEIEKPEGADDTPANDTGNGGGSGDDEPAGTTQTNSRSKKKEPRLAKSEWWRELTVAEAKVQFSSIQKKADNAESKLVDAVKPVIDKISDDATKRLEPLLEKQGVKAIDGFELKYQSELKGVFYDHMLDMYGLAKNGAADELGVDAPANKQTSKDIMREHCAAVADKQMGDMLFELKHIVTEAVRKNQLERTDLSVASVIASIAAAFVAFFNDKEALTASSLITAALNIGRDDVFKANDPKIYGYQYSAILDDKVCKICEDLDGNVVNKAEYTATRWMPPIHFHCRCIWVAILKEEQEKPDFTGLPDAPGGAIEPLLSYEQDGVQYEVFLSAQSAKLWAARNGSMQN